MLDGLHEDLNNVLVKPYVEDLDISNNNEEKLDAIKAENNFLSRNQSIIQELLNGQYKSTLICPDCKKISIKYDAFLTITLPVSPDGIVRSKNLTSLTIYFMNEDSETKNAKLIVNYSSSML